MREIDTGLFRLAPDRGRGDDLCMDSRRLLDSGRLGLSRCLHLSRWWRIFGHRFWCCSSLVDLEHNQRRADRDDVAGFAGQRDNFAGDRRREFDGGLIGHHGADDVFLGDLIADVDEPLADLRFDGAFAEVRQLEDVFAHSVSITLRMPAAMRFCPGKYCHSNACG